VPDQLKFGITLSNRGVLLGLTTPRDLLRMADMAEACPLIDSVWVGDALFVNRRLDALTLLAAVAGRTERVLLGPACMGSYALRNPLVFAYEWASLDQIAHGRTRLVACAGGGAGPLWEAESRAMGVLPEERRKRMIEHMHVMRHLWTRDNEPYAGQFFQFSGITLEPKPVNGTCPIWLATNATRLSSGYADNGGSEIALKRVGRHADGWMTHSVSPQGFASSWQRILDEAVAAGRDAGTFGNVLYSHINVGSDMDAALADSKQFLDMYYGADYTPQRLKAWGAFGTAKQCIDTVRPFRGSGCERVTFRVSTMRNPLDQLRRVIEEVLPAVNAGSVEPIAA